jgi:N,N'-diacetyllegionaminate synthase
MIKNIYLIAEIGINHNGSLDITKKLIDNAKEAKFDAVKFQNFTAEKLVTKDAKKAPYQAKNTKNNKSQLDMLKKLELKKDYYYELCYSICSIQLVLNLSGLNKISIS